MLLNFVFERLKRIFTWIEKTKISDAWKKTMLDYDANNQKQMNRLQSKGTINQVSLLSPIWDRTIILVPSSHFYLVFHFLLWSILSQYHSILSQSKKFKICQKDKANTIKDLIFKPHAGKVPTWKQPLWTSNNTFPRWNTHRILWADR